MSCCGINITYAYAVDLCITRRNENRHEAKITAINGTAGCHGDDQVASLQV